MRAFKVRVPAASIASGVFLLCWVSPSGNAAAAPAHAEGNNLEAGVRELIEKNCGSCHDGALSTAKPAALKVFDLQEENWTRRMSDEQLKKVTGRTRGLDLPENQKQQVVDFIQLKLKERATRRAAIKSAASAGETKDRSPSSSR
jgi:hypothetical protein